jgi:quinol monooxygenase YgiN
MLVEAASSMKDLAYCELYIVNGSETETEVVWVTEVWSDSNAQQQSVTTEAVKALIERGRPLILRMQATKAYTFNR